MKFLAVAALGLLLAPLAKGDNNSLYQIESTWLNQDGKAVQLKEFTGKPVLFSMVYLSCKFSCPLVISKVQSIRDGLPKNDSAQSIHVVLVSIDPQNDKPATLKAYMKKRKLSTSAGWTLLTAKSDFEVRELAAAVNFKYEKSGARDYSHSFMILSLDRAGVVQARINEVNQDHAPLLSTLTKSLAL